MFSSNILASSLPSAPIPDTSARLCTNLVMRFPTNWDPSVEDSHEFAAIQHRMAGYSRLQNSNVQLQQHIIHHEVDMLWQDFRRLQEEQRELREDLEALNRRIQQMNLSRQSTS